LLKQFSNKFNHQKQDSVLSKVLLKQISDHFYGDTLTKRVDV